MIGSTLLFLLGTISPKFSQPNIRYIDILKTEASIALSKKFNPLVEQTVLENIRLLLAHSVAECRTQD